MKPKIESYLGFAKKSRNLVEGIHTCEVYAKKKKIELIITASDLGKSSKEKIEKICSKEVILLENYSTKEKLGEIIGKEQAGVIGIIDKHFAKIIQEEIIKERG